MFLETRRKVSRVEYRSKPGQVQRGQNKTNYYVTQVLSCRRFECTLWLLLLEHSAAAFVIIGILISMVGLHNKGISREGRCALEFPFLCGARLPVRIGPCAERIGGP